MSSIFSKIIAGEIPCYKIAEDEHHFAFLDIFPVAKGHVLVVPKKETDYFFDMEDSNMTSLMLFAKKIAIAIEKTISCERIGMTVLGLEVPHAHIHLVPLDEKGVIRFSKKLKFSKEEFEEIAAGIRANIGTL
ncbi:MAG: HIT family protein [Chitinophagales bacterium]